MLGHLLPFQFHYFSKNSRALFFLLELRARRTFRYQLDLRLQSLADAYSFVATLIASVVVARPARTLFVATQLDILSPSLFQLLASDPAAAVLRSNKRSEAKRTPSLKNLKHIRSADFDTPHLRPALQLVFLLHVIDVDYQNAYAKLPKRLCKITKTPMRLVAEVTLFVKRSVEFCCNYHGIQG